MEKTVEELCVVASALGKYFVPHRAMSPAPIT